MLRTLFVLMFAAAASSAWCAEPLPADAEAPHCEKATAQAGKDSASGSGGAATARPGAPAPVRPRSANGRGTPRWHSLLPGMIR